MSVEEKRMVAFVLLDHVILEISISKIKRKKRPNPAHLGWNAGIPRELRLPMHGYLENVF
ncbi:hypothetical protein [Nitrosomonas sp. Nm84]|uniref:hypothetical protein n=1 Tax=Nitrosomonas sp. Nm84 TaxID=200124 RepID=UPI000D772A43|nr:hypothetical protein [Nitrosomonas sp. Nm84]